MYLVKPWAKYFIKEPSHICDYVLKCQNMH